MTVTEQQPTTAAPLPSEDVAAISARQVAVVYGAWNGLVWLKSNVSLAVAPWLRSRMLHDTGLCLRTCANKRIF